MIQFMLLAAPRSGTAWASNWLTTDTSLCLHDPLWNRHYLELDGTPTAKMLGVACTGLALFPTFVKTHPARKVVLHRDLREVDASLAKIGMPPTPPGTDATLRSIDGLHCSWRDLFENPRRIYEYCLQKPFDAERHQALCGLEVQTRFEGIRVDPGVTRRLIAEMQAAVQERLQ